MNIDLASIKELGIPTIFVLFGLFLLGLTFIDLPRSEGKWQIKTRKDPQWKMAIIGGILIIIGIALPSTPYNPDGLIQNARATISSLETQIVEQKFSAETQEAVAQSTYETQQAIVQSTYEAQIPTGTIVALHTKLAAAQETSSALGTSQVDFQATQTVEVGTLLGEISALGTELAATPKVITATPSPTESPPQKIIEWLGDAFSTTHAKLEKPQTDLSAELDGRFHDDAKSNIEYEINLLRNSFLKITNPNWVLEDVRIDTRIGDTYEFIVKHTVTFTGQFRCPEGGSDVIASITLQFKESKLRVWNKKINADDDPETFEFEGIIVYKTVFVDDKQETINNIKDQYCGSGTDNQ